MRLRLSRLNSGQWNHCAPTAALLREPGHSGFMSTVSTVLTSAVVSGAVALFFEWVAKPRMDARKERVLRVISNRRTFEDNLLRLDVASAVLNQFKYPPNASRDTKDALDAERRRYLQQMDSATQSMMDEIGFFALTYASVKLPRLGISIPEMISRYVFCVRAVYLSGRSYTRKAEIIQELTVPMRTYLFGSKLHPIRRMNASAEMPELLNKYTSPDNLS